MRFSFFVLVEKHLSQRKLKYAGIDHQEEIV